MNKFTPGPWYVDEDTFVATGHRDTYICIADPHSSNDLDIDEREANAQLIAAAPELLEALESIVDWISIHDKAAEKYNRCKEIIAKAKGEGQ